MRGSVRLRGDRWYYSFDLAKVGGKRKRIERIGGRTKKEADAALRAAIEKYQKAGQLLDETDLSVADYFDYWFKNYVEVGLRYNTQVSYGVAIGHIKDSLGSYHLSKLTPGAVQKYLNQRHLDGRARGTIQIELAVITKALNMAVFPYQFIRDNPARYASIPKAAKKPKAGDLKMITPDNYKRLLGLFPEGSKYHLPILIGYHTGLRLSEIAGLTWDCIDLEGKRLSVKKIEIYEVGKGYILNDPKTPTSVRTLSISSFLVRALKSQQLAQTKNALLYGMHYDRSAFVCTSESGKHVDIGSLKGLSRTVDLHLDFRFSFHRLRHTHASLLLASGVSMKAIQLRLGHAKITTTMDVYAHLTEDLEKTTAEHLEKLAEL
jgi:ATP-dependent helicase/nuclease subunit A